MLKVEKVATVEVNGYRVTVKDAGSPYWATANMLSIAFDGSGSVELSVGDLKTLANELYEAASSFD